jgi:YHS domain-containing protein
MKRFSLTLAFLFAASLPAFGGEQYVDGTGYAVSGYDVVAYHGLAQSASAIPGRSDITAKYNGAVFAFSNVENRDKFLSNPAKYAPQFDGHCAFGVSKGGKVPANPNLWRVVDGKLYLNITRNVAGFWTSDIPGNISRGNSSWVNLEAAPASTRPVPEFTSSAPTKN